MMVLNLGESVTNFRHTKMSPIWNRENHFSWVNAESYKFLTMVLSLFLNSNCLQAIKPYMKGYSWYPDQILSKKEQPYPYKAVSIINLK